MPSRRLATRNRMVLSLRANARVASCFFAYVDARTWHAPDRPDRSRRHTIRRCPFGMLRAPRKPHSRIGVEPQGAAGFRSDIDPRPRRADLQKRRTVARCKRPGRYRSEQLAVTSSVRIATCKATHYSIKQAFRRDPDHPVTRPALNTSSFAYADWICT